MKAEYLQEYGHHPGNQAHPHPPRLCATGQGMMIRTTSYYGTEFFFPGGY